MVCKGNKYYMNVFQRSEMRQNMNKSVEEYRAEIKKILEEFYELQSVHNKIGIQMPEGYDIPSEMLTGEVETDTKYNIKLVTWKMIPSDITEKEIAELEKEIKMRLPDPLRAYYTSYYHLWDLHTNISENSPQARMSGIYSSYNELIIKFGYLPFTWDIEGAWLYCMKFDENNNDCGIYWIDHEYLFGFDSETVTAQEIEKVMEFQAKDFCEYLYNETIGMAKYFIENGLYRNK